MAKKFSRLISLCMVFLMIFMASLQGNAYAYKNTNNWNDDGSNKLRPRNVTLENEGSLKVRSFDTVGVRSWNDRNDIFEHPQRVSKTEWFGISNNIEKKSAKVFWGYIQPLENVWYKFDVEGSADHFAVIFENMNEVANFSSNPQSYYSKDVGDHGSAWIIGKKGQAYGSPNGSDLSSGYIKLNKNRIYPIYMESYNADDGTNQISIKGHYWKNKNRKGSFNISEYYSWVDIYPADREFISYDYRQSNDIEIDWEGGIQTPDDRVSKKGYLSTREFEALNEDSMDWNDRDALFSGKKKDKKEERVNSIGVSGKEIGNAWGYFVPNEDGYYCLGIRGSSSNFGMIFNGMAAVAEFNERRQDYYGRTPGYENNGALVIGNDHQTGNSQSTDSEMYDDDSQKKIFVRLKKGQSYPVYAEYYNDRGWNGDINIFYHMKPDKYSGSGSETYVGSYGTKIDAYPSNLDFVDHEERVPNGVNIDWAPGLSGSNDLEQDQQGVFSFRDYMTNHIKDGEWDDRSVLFAGQKTVRYRDWAYEEIKRRKDSAGVIWGYIIPWRDGYYSFGMRGENTAHYGMLFNSMEAVSRFDNDKDAYYPQEPGFEKDGAIVIGNDFEEGYQSSFSEMNDSSDGRIYVKMTRGRIYPIYLQYYNDKPNDEGNVGLFYHYKDSKYGQEQGRTVLDNNNYDKVSIFSSSKDFVTEYVENGVNIDWEDGNRDYDEVDDAWRLSYKRVHTPEMKEDDWKDRYELFGGQFTSIYEGDVKRMGPNGLENVGPAGVFENSRGLVWGYIEPQQSGYYSFSIFGQHTGKFGMMFEDMDGVRRFDSNKEAFYGKPSGYEKDGMLVMGNEFRPVNGHGETDMVNSDGERIFVKLEQGKKYPVYMEYFNSSKYYSGSIGLNYYYKSKANERPEGSLMLGFDSKLKTYSSNEDFVSFKRYEMPEDLIDSPGYLNEQYFSVSDMPSISQEWKWTDKSEIFSDAKKLGNSSFSYAGTLPKGSSGRAESGYSKGDETYVFFDWIRHHNTQSKMIKKTWGYIVPKENIDRIALLSDDGVNIEIREVNPATGERTTIAAVSDFETQVWGGVMTPKLDLKAGKAYEIYIEYFNWGGDGRFVMLYNGSQGHDYMETRGAIKDFYENLMTDARDGETLQLDASKIKYTHGKNSTYMKTMPAQWFFPTRAVMDATDLKNAIDKGNRLSGKLADASYSKNYDADLDARLNTVLAKAQEIYDGRYKSVDGLDGDTVRNMLEELLSSKDKESLRSRHADKKYTDIIDGKAITTVQDLIDAMTIITREAILDLQNSVKMTGLEAKYDSAANKYDFTWDEFKGAKQYELSLIDAAGKVTVVGLIDARTLSTSGGKASYEYTHAAVVGADFRVRAVLDELEFTFKYTGYSNTANDDDALAITSSNKKKGINGYEDIDKNTIHTKYGQEIVPVVEFNINSNSVYGAKIQIDVKGNSLMTYKYPKIRLIRDNGGNQYQSKGFTATITQDVNSYRVIIDPDESHLEIGRYMVEIDTAMTIEDAREINKTMSANKAYLGKLVGDGVIKSSDTSNWRFPYVVEHLTDDGTEIGNHIKDGLSIDTTITWDPSEASNSEDRRSYSDESININITNKNELPGSF